MGKTLVTGGAGFIGSHLVEELVKQGLSVVVMDDFSNGQKENLANVVDDIEVVKCDVSMPFESIIKKLDGYSFDGIFHLACHPRSFSLEKPFRDLDVNARGMLNILELAKTNENCKVVFTSNSGIYGEPKYLPIDEHHSDNPTTPYDANKLVSEHYCKIYHRIYGVPIAICRLATVYGERQRTTPIWKPVITEFITKLLNNRTPQVCWDGEQTRDFIYVADVVMGLLEAYNADTKDGVYILGTGEETSIGKIYKIISKRLDVEKEPLKGEKVKGDIRRMCYSSQKAKERFGFTPKYSLEEGIKSYVEDLKEIKKRS